MFISIQVIQTCTLGEWCLSLQIGYDVIRIIYCNDSSGITRWVEPLCGPFKIFLDNKLVFHQTHYETRDSFSISSVDVQYTAVFHRRALVNNTTLPQQQRDKLSHSPVNILQLLAAMLGLEELRGERVLDWYVLVSLRSQIQINVNAAHHQPALCH